MHASSAPERAMTDRGLVAASDQSERRRRPFVPADVRATEQCPRFLTPCLYKTIQRRQNISQNISSKRVLDMDRAADRRDRSRILQTGVDVVESSRTVQPRSGSVPSRAKRST